MKSMPRDAEPQDFTKALELDDYEQEIVLEAIRRHYKHLVVEQSELLEACALQASTEEDWRNNPDISGAEEWLSRTETLLKRVKKEFRS
jgi:hypothetical protein